MDNNEPISIVAVMQELFAKAKQQEGMRPVYYTMHMSWSTYRRLFPRRARIVGMLNKVKR